MSKSRPKAVKAGRRAVRNGERPRYHVSIADRTDMPWLEFDGRRPAEIAEAARRAIAGELRVRADQIEVQPVARPATETADAPADDDR